MPPVLAPVGSFFRCCRCCRLLYPALLLLRIVARCRCFRINVPGGQWGKKRKNKKTSVNTSGNLAPASNNATGNQLYLGTVASIQCHENDRSTKVFSLRRNTCLCLSFATVWWSSFADRRPIQDGKSEWGPCACSVPGRGLPVVTQRAVLVRFVLVGAWCGRPRLGFFPATVWKWNEH